MKKMLFIILIFFTTIYTTAMPSCNLPYKITQKDGSSFMAVQKGDEWNNRVETVDGYTILKNDKGYWVYATQNSRGELVSSNLLVNSVHPARFGIKKHLRGKLRKINMHNKIRRSSRKDQPLLIILVKFSDQDSTYTPSQFQNLFFSATDSVKEYFIEATKGNITMVPAVESDTSDGGAANDGIVGWVSLPINHPNTSGSLVSANKQITRDAMAAADPYIDYSSYDTDSNGYLSNEELSVVIVVAGYEASWGGHPDPSVWGHRWSLDHATGTVPYYTGDGVGVGYFMYNGGYCQFGEVHSGGSEPHIATIGIMCHELGHLCFGLPDLYDTDSSSNGIGCWGLMGGGSWGKFSSDAWYMIGAHPVHLCAWSKMTLNYETPTVIPTTSGTYTIWQSSDNTPANVKVYRVNTSDPEEFFLIENRQLTGYDKGLDRWVTGGGGLLIYHIDSGQGDNDDETHKKVDIEEAEGIQDLDLNPGGTKGERADLFFQARDSTFTDTTTPNAKLYNNSNSGVNINTISTSGPSMTFKMGTTAVELSYFGTEVKEKYIDIKWETASESNNAGFYVWRSEAKNGKYVKLNKKLIPSKGNTTSGFTYFFTDFVKMINNKTYYYKLQDVDYGGKSIFHGPIEATIIK